MEETRTQHTDAILNCWAGHKDEFSKLHAILCLLDGWSAQDSVAMREIIDFGRIAGRLDELNNIASRKALLFDIERAAIASGYSEQTLAECLATWQDWSLRELQAVLLSLQSPCC